MFYCAGAGVIVNMMEKMQSGLSDKLKILRCCPAVVIWVEV